MRKIKLDVDALEVESFDTEGGGVEERGTVRGHYDRSYPNWDCPVTWGNYACQSISGQVACLCADPSEGECVSFWCVEETEYVCIQPTEYVEFC